MSFLDKILPRDKQLHAAAGTAAALLGVATWFVLGQFMVLPVAGYAVCAQLCGFVAGVTKEVADYMDNTAAMAAGRPDSHDVSAWDAIATAAPGAAVALLVTLAILL